MSENSSFICLTRSLIEKSAWVDARPTYQTIFMHILLRCAFKETEHNIHGNIIKVLPGQLCTTIRQIEDWSGKWISKNDVEGCIKYFKKVDFLRQEIRHGKSIITIIEPDIYKTLIRGCQTNIQTEVRQESDIKEECKERKEIITIPAGPVDKVVNFNFQENFNDSLSDVNERVDHVSEQKVNITYNIRTNPQEKETNSNKKVNKENKSKTKINSDEYRNSLIERRHNIFSSEKEHLELIKQEGIEFVDRCYDHLSDWKTSKSLNDPKTANAHSDFYRIKKWVIQAVKEDSVQNKSEKISSPIDLEANEKLAITAGRIFESKTCDILVNYEQIEFVRKWGTKQGDVLKFNEHGFKDRLNKLIELNNCEKRKITNQKATG